MSYVSLEDIVPILRLMVERPNERRTPKPGDLEGKYSRWFDGGAMKGGHTGTGLRFAFLDGSRAWRRGSGKRIDIDLADGRSVQVTIEAQEDVTQAQRR